MHLSSGKKTWYTLNLNVCAVHVNLLTYVYPNIIHDNPAFKAFSGYRGLFLKLFLTISNLIFSLNIYFVFFAGPH